MTINLKDSKTIKIITGLAVVIVFLALIRCVGEYFRLHYTIGSGLTAAQMEPFMWGAMVCAIACLAMTIMQYFNLYRTIIITAALTIVILFIIKAVFAI